ncbi:MULTISPECIES: ankyrin repeat domain-containing protein [unclassified Leptospira]|uniref:ankyrin repeat domain-containing protein n=1 Tax=unclassified Leptospira TaxID=2633828 RepID=UPI00029265BA|nr:MULTISPECIES: ankyrin repeat domain-containing protein [unclassified Leptospira]EKO80189.1 ankyrin repeat protein [Leptospira sp. Fiocruz LV3954]EMI67793.1 ankyrin repeat protein [Leptospira sp. Fiocruz LV4135]
MPFFVRLLYKNPSPTRCKKKLLNQNRYFLFFILIFLFSGPVFASPISNADRKILSAAINGNIRLAKKALQQGASVHAKDPLERNLGETPLHKVAFNNDVEFLRFLLNEGADPNLSDERGETPLITAVYGLSLESVSALLGAKADPYLETTSGINAAVLAADLCSLPLLQILKNAGVDLNRPTKKGFLPIHTAAGRCNGKFLKFLIESGADPQTPTKTGTTPLMQAIKLGNLDAIQFLLEQNVSVSSVDRYGYDSMFYLLARKKDYTLLRSRRNNLIHYKANRDRLKDIILRLIEKGAPLYREYEDGTTPLFLILTMDDDDLQKFFLDYFKNRQIDLNVPNRFGITPFQYYQMRKELLGPEDEERKNRINRFLLERNSENPTFAFYYIYLLCLHDYEYYKIQNNTLRKIYSSLLDLPKLPDFKNLELKLWKQIFATKDPDLKKKLLSRFPDPPAGFWRWISLDEHEDLPSDPEELSALWVRSIQKGDTINIIEDYWFSKIYAIYARHGIYHALETCNWNLLDQLSSQTSLWKLVDPNQFWKNYRPSCLVAKEETMVYRLFQSTPSSAKIVSPLCNEIEFLAKLSQAEEIERSRKRILNFVKMGAKPDCGFKDSDDWISILSKALETVRKQEFTDLEKIILSFDVKDPQKIPLKKAIAEGDRNKIQNLLEQGAIIDVEELKLAQKNPELLSYLLEEYNSLDSSPVFDSIMSYFDSDDRAKPKNDPPPLALLLEKGFSLKVRLDYEYMVANKNHCAITKLIHSDFKNLKSILKSQNILNYSCRGFDFEFYKWGLHPSIRDSWSQEKIKTKIKALQLESVFPDLWEESYFFEPKS